MRMVKVGTSSGEIYINAEKIVAMKPSPEGGTILSFEGVNIGLLTVSDEVEDLARRINELGRPGAAMPLTGSR